MIELTAGDGRTLSAYRADPEGTPKGAVVVLQENAGAPETLQSLAKSYAALGYVAIAPYLLEEAKKEPASEEAGLTEERTRAFTDIQAAIDAVKGAGKVAVVGYGWGAYLAYAAVNRVRGLACAVGYDGGGIVSDYCEKRKAPTLVHFAAADADISEQAVIQFRARRPDVTAFSYPASQGFNSPHRDSYHEDSAKAAHERTVFFISQFVEGQPPIALKNAGAYSAAKVEKKKKAKAGGDDMGPPMD